MRMGARQQRRARPPPLPPEWRAGAAPLAGARRHRLGAHARRAPHRCRGSGVHEHLPCSLRHQRRALRRNVRPDQHVSRMAPPWRLLEVERCADADEPRRRDALRRARSAAATHESQESARRREVVTRKPRRLVHPSGDQEKSPAMDPPECAGHQCHHHSQCPRAQPCPSLQACVRDSVRHEPRPRLLGLAVV